MIQYNLQLIEDKNIKKRIRVSLRFPLTLFVDTSNGIILVTVLKKIKSTKNSIQSSAFHVTQKTARNVGYSLSIKRRDENIAFNMELKNLS